MVSSILFLNFNAGLLIDKPTANQSNFTLDYIR